MIDPDLLVIFACSLLVSCNGELSVCSVNDEFTATCWESWDSIGARGWAMTLSGLV